ncbi:hypothetical protein [Tepidamorphus gemmatus]|nr:hypothetical protein [Tepidamorphus gemmatus]
MFSLFISITFDPSVLPLDLFISVPLIVIALPRDGRKARKRRRRR